MQLFKMSVFESRLKFSTSPLNSIKNSRISFGSFEIFHRKQIFKSRRMRLEGYVARMGEKRNADRLLVGKLDGTRPLGRPRRKWVDNIRMDLEEVGWGGVDWIGLVQDRNRWRALVNSVLNLRVP
jgi:hypothetical protein